jgi:threonine dehydratase
VIAASAGNHAQGLAYHGKRLGIPVTIVMPSTTPIGEDDRRREGHGATVVLHGETFDAAYAHARELEVERGLTFVHPFDLPACHRGPGHRGARNARGRAGIDTLDHPDRRRRADLGHGNVAARGTSPICG